LDRKEEHVRSKNSAQVQEGTGSAYWGLGERRIVTGGPGVTTKKMAKRAKVGTSRDAEKKKGTLSDQKHS